MNHLLNLYMYWTCYPRDQLVHSNVIKSNNHFKNTIRKVIYHSQPFTHNFSFLLPSHPFLPSFLPSSTTPSFLNFLSSSFTCYMPSSAPYASLPLSSNPSFLPSFLFRSKHSFFYNHRVMYLYFTYPFSPSYPSLPSLLSSLLHIIPLTFPCPPFPLLVLHLSMREGEESQ